MSTLGRRINVVFKENEMDVKKFSSITSIDENIINSYINNECFPNELFFFVFKRVFPTMNLNWLITNEQPRYFTDLNDIIYEIDERLRQLEAYQQHLQNWAQKYQPVKENEVIINDNTKTATEEKLKRKKK